MQEAVKGIHGDTYYRRRRVEAGQLLDLVRITGYAHPTFPEDRQTRRGEVNPLPFLLAWRGSHNVTPPLPTP
jgi:hypothetical protein